MCSALLEGSYPTVNTEQFRNFVVAAVAKVKEKLASRGFARKPREAKDVSVTVTTRET